MTRNTFLTLVFAATLSTAPVFAASAAIGVATAVTSFSVDNSTVTGNANVFDGTELQTTIAPSDVRLRNGVDVRLATRSAGTVFNDRVVLRQGAVRITNFGSYAVKASQLQIEADSPETQAVVRMTGKKIEVASLGGTLRVTDGGAMLTRVASGTRVFFQSSPPAQTGAAPAQTGAAPAPEVGPVSDKKTYLWAAGICAVGGAIAGGVAAAQGKSPFHGK